MSHSNELNPADAEYFRLLQLVLSQGRVKKNRTGVDTLGIFGAQARFDLKKGFPLLTTKKVFFKAIVHELLWFLSGSTNIKYLVDNNVHIWDEWAYKRYVQSWVKEGFAAVSCPPMEVFVENIRTNAKFAEQWGELGEGTYGGMWRSFPYTQYKERDTFDFDGKPFLKGWTETGAVDQIQKVEDTLKNNPDDRRMIVSAWHPYWVDNCALPPCHCLFQFHTEELTLEERRVLVPQEALDGDEDSPFSVKREKLSEDSLEMLAIPTRRLNCQLYIRSNDLFLGCPFNIASYALLIELIAHVVGMAAGELVYTIGDAHLYTNHIEQARLQLTRIPYDLPKLLLNKSVKNLFDFRYEDIQIVDYQCHPAIKADVAV